MGGTQQGAQAGAPLRGEESGTPGPRQPTSLSLRSPTRRCVSAWTAASSRRCAVGEWSTSGAAVSRGSEPRSTAWRLAMGERTLPGSPVSSQRFRSSSVGAGTQLWRRVWASMGGGHREYQHTAATTPPGRISTHRLQCAPWLASRQRQGTTGWTGGRLAGPLSPSVGGSQELVFWSLSSRSCSSWSMDASPNRSVKSIASIVSVEGLQRVPGVLVWQCFRPPPKRAACVPTMSGLR